MSTALGVNADLAVARARGRFDVELMTHMLDGGMTRTVMRRHFRSVIEAEPVFDNSMDIMEDRVTR